MALGGGEGEGYAHLVVGDGRVFAQLWHALQQLMGDKRRNPRNLFNSPVEPSEVANYYAVVASPMDLGSVKSRLEDGLYARVGDFVADVLLVFANAKQFNPPQDLIYQYAHELQGEFLNQMQLLCLDQEGDKICASCSQGQLELDPQLAGLTLTCSTCQCAIKPNTDYYRIGNDRGQHWCVACYDKLPSEFYGVLGQRVPKSVLEPMHSTCQVEYESWMQCQQCLAWWHSTCALGATTLCPLHAATTLPLPPSCAMAEYIERRVHAHAISELTARPRSPGHAVLQPQLGLDDAKQVAQTLVCRVLSSFAFSSSVVEEGARIKRWVEYQAKASGRSSAWAVSPTQRVEKCVGVFQHDILCFVLYVYEYAKCVYISYLDSCAFIQPRRLRSGTYQAVMAAYFSWVQERYERVYLWASPPNEGDAYVFNARPFWQRNPTPERLKRWYAQLFKHCRKQGILVSGSLPGKEHRVRFPPLYMRR